MDTDHERLKEILAEATAKPSPAERASYLDVACRGDPGLRARVEALLGAHDQAGEFLEEPLVALSLASIVDSPLLTEQPHERIRRYKLLERIGEGGSAVVYVAEQEEPVRRRVALKVIKLGMDTRSVVARFEAERQALAMMDHPNIAKVFDAGATETGRPFFVMELARGIKITDYCDRNDLLTNERLELFIQVCHAIQHAHQKGIIHRDIKPSNILVTLHDGVPVPKVIDFGIAKATGQQRLTDKTLYTAFEQFIGTPAYMSPEQADMSPAGAGDIDTRSDIYSLGVLLYELLTGKTPFESKTLLAAGMDEMRRIIREQEPARPSTRLTKLAREERTTTAQRRQTEPPRLIRMLQGDLDWITLKCLEKDRRRRYETANGLALDIERHLNNEPVMARPPSTIYRFRKLVRRNKGVFAGAAAVATTLVVGLTISIVSLVAEHRARQLAVAAQEKEAALRQEAEARELYARRLAYASDVRLAQEALAGNDLGQAVRLLEAHRPAPGELDLRGWEWRYLWQECRSEAIGELCRYSMGYSVAYSPDGKLLAAWRGNMLWEIWDLASRKGIKVLPRRFGHLVAFSPCGDLLVTDTKDQKGIQLWKTGTWDPVEHLPLDGEVRAISFSPDGSRLASVSCPEDLIIWAIDQTPVVPHRHIRGVRPVLTNPHHKALDFSPDGKAVVVGEADGRLRVFDVATGSTNADIARAHHGAISALAWSLDFDDPIIASNGSHIGGTIRLWDAVTGNERGSLEGHSAWISTLIFSADGRRLYSASGDQTIRIWDVRRQRCLAILRGSRDEIYGMALAPDGRALVSADRNGVVAFWDAHPRPREEQPKVIPSDVYCMPAFAPAGGVLAVPRDGIVSLFDLATLEEVERLPELGEDVRKITYSPDGTLLVSDNGRGKLRVWSCSERRLLGELDDLHNDLNTFNPWMGLLGFQRDGTERLILARSVHGRTRVTLWDPAMWQAIRAFDVEVLWQGRVSSDGCFLAVFYGDNAVLTATVHWLSAETGRVLAPEIRAHRAAIQQLAFSADGLQAASASMDGTVTLYDVSSFEQIASFQAHMNTAIGVAFSPDGLRLATSGSEWAVKLWDLSTRRKLMILPGHGLIPDAAFSPDNRWLITHGTEGQLHLWHAPSWAEIEAAERHLADVRQGDARLTEWQYPVATDCR